MNTTVATRIPKIIHFCWFGKNPYPEVLNQCIASWKKFLPDYTIMAWTEENFEINSSLFAQQAYAEKKWAFVADVARLHGLYNYGGIYLDIDTEALKNLDVFLQHGAFCGYEADRYVNCGLIGAEKGHPFIKKILDYYDGRPFILENGKYDLTPIPVIVTTVLEKEFQFQPEKKAYQELKDNIAIYPRDYFSPQDPVDGRIRMTKNTHAIHHYHASWVPPFQKFKGKLHKLFARVFGQKVYFGLRKLLKK